jgi:hypothetical protein
MSQLGTYKSKRFTLPSSKHLPEAEQDWVELRSVVFARDLEVMYEYDTITEQVAAGLSATILDWSFTEADGSKAAITYDNILRMDATDFNYLKDISRDQIEEAQGGLSAEEKKTSTASTEAVTPNLTPDYSPPVM